jgi:hypothetical protein
MSEDEQEIIDLYKTLIQRIRGGSRSVMFNQAAEMVFQIDLMVDSGFEADSIVIFCREYKKLLYELD